MRNISNSYYVDYESDLRRSIYDGDARDSWFSVTRYYDVATPVELTMDIFHAHTEVEIMYAKEGRGLVILEDGEEITMRRGSFVFLDSLVPHTLIVDEDNPFHMLNIEASLSAQRDNVSLGILGGDSCFRSFLSAGLPVFSGMDDRNVIYNGITNLQRLLQLGAAAVGIDMQLSCILLEIGRQYDQNRNRMLGTYAYVRRARKFIAENFDHDISVDDVADAAMISKSHLSRVFRELEGVTIVEEINRLRLEKAKLLLKDSRMPVVDIAVELGFSSRQYFTGLFTRKNGCPPSVYRKRHIDENIVEGHAILNEELEMKKLSGESGGLSGDS